MATRAFLGMCVDCPRFGERPRGLAEQALIVVSKEGRITSVGRGAEIATARERLERDGVELRVIPEMATEEFIKYTQLRGTEQAHRLKCSASQESLDEVDFSAHLFDSADAEVFARFGLLQGQPGQAASVMAHCVQMKQVKQLIGQGMKVGLGTDVAGGYSPSMLSAMRAAVLASKSLQFRSLARPSPRFTWQLALGSVPGGVSESNMAPTCTVAEAKEMHDLNHFEALYLATMGGATALGLAEHLGTFDEGKCFDAVLLNRWRGGSPADSPEDMLLKIITLGDDRNVQEVFVNGRCVYQIDST
eukprot:Skav209184  [mRNA]  locus=scaffold1137:625723:634073:+ [translate_table: standard]